MKKLLIIFVVFLLIISIFPRCAKIVTPNGGPKDTIPPVLVRSVPGINSTNFKGDKITLTFDEFVKLKDIQKKLAISPPLTKKPEFNQKGKSIEIKLKEPLKDSTTYTFYFSDAIEDNNEGNPLKNFVFAFSTGKTIDSLAVSGSIIDAFTLMPVENAFIMLYKSWNDSVPIKDLPRYLTRSDKKGLFTISNIQPDNYKVFGLVDNNSNYKFDQISEDIAFLKDTLKKEALIGPSKIDTSRYAKRVINLRMFKEDPRLQAFTGFNRTKRRKISLSFTKEPTGEVSLNPTNFRIDSSWFVKEYSPLKDTLIYWITNDRVSKMDTLKIELGYLKSDSLGRLQPKKDTIKLSYSDPEEPKKRKRDKEEKVKRTYLKVNCSIRNTQAVKPLVNEEIGFPIPLKRLNADSLLFMNLKDSATIKGVKLVQDTLNPRLYRFKYDWKPDVPYAIKIFPGAFTSLDGLKNDTIKINFTGANPDNYGILNVHLLNTKSNVIVELCNEKRTKVVDSKISKNGESVTFSFIDPGTYSLRFIEDTNGNGKWDTGWYLKGIQPETVYHYLEGKTKGIMNIRANWENDITFDFGK